MHPLRKYLAGQNISLIDFARKIETSQIYLYHIIAGRRKPSLTLAKRIYEETGGMVKPADLRPDLAELCNLP